MTKHPKIKELYPGDILIDHCNVDGIRVYQLETYTKDGPTFKKITREEYMNILEKIAKEDDIDKKQDEFETEYEVEMKMIELKEVDEKEMINEKA